MDVAGEVQVAAERNIHRIRLDSKGNRIGLAEYEDHAHDADDAAARDNPALNPMIQALGLNFPLQQQGGPDLHTDQRGEGCNIVGTLLVNKVAGNVHVALGGAHAHGGATKDGKEPPESEEHSHGGGAPHAHASPSHPSAPPQPQHIHQFMIHDLVSYNCSHRINRLSFGVEFPGALNPLDGTEQVIPEGGGTAHFQYFVKVVPTLYQSSSGREKDTNQYSVTQQSQFISLQDAFRGDTQRIPGVFFVYDLSPFMVRVTERRTPLSTFLTSVCAIVGGVLTVAGVIDAALFSGAKYLKVVSPTLKK